MNSEDFGEPAQLSPESSLLVNVTSNKILVCQCLHLKPYFLYVNSEDFGESTQLSPESSLLINVTNAKILVWQCLHLKLCFVYVNSEGFGESTQLSPARQCDKYQDLSMVVSSS